MAEYQPALVVIIASLLCIVPFALFLLWQFGQDIIYIITQNMNRNKINLFWVGDKPLPEALSVHHKQLVELGFMLLGAYERQAPLKRHTAWAYRHLDKPTVFVTIAHATPVKFTTFATAFDDDEIIMTLNGVNLQLDSNQATINTVSGSLSETYSYHQRVVESEIARFGKPFAITTVDDFMPIMESIRDVHITAMLRAYYSGARGLFFLFWMISAIVGLTGFVLILLKRLSFGNVTLET
jgi:hypothetical protein